MSLINSVSQDHNIHQILIEEGFKSLNGDYHYELSVDQEHIIRIKIEEKFMYCTLENTVKKSIIRQGQIGNNKAKFIERYFSLLETVINYKNIKQFYEA